MKKIADFSFSLPYILFIFSSLNLTAQIFVESNQELLNQTQGSVDWGDFDNDGYLDILTTGINFSLGTVVKETRILKNNGDGVFTESFSGQIIGVQGGQALWGDFNNDGLLDIFVTGDVSAENCVGCEKTTKIYINNGSGFEDLLVNNIPGFSQGDVALGDLDNDGDLDIVLSGIADGFATTDIYYNDDLSFETNEPDFLPNLNFATVDLGDFDNDGDQDLLLSGAQGTAQITKIFENVDGNFNEFSNGSFQGVIGTAEWIDYDMDGNLDIVVTGSWSEDGVDGFFAGIYQNVNGNFQEVFNGDLTHGIIDPCISVGDYDNDGDMDIILAGNQSFIDQSLRMTRIYQNNDTEFTALTDESLTGLDNCFCKWGDSDNDDDLDILIIGNPNVGSFSDIILNTITEKNTSPEAPSNLSVEVNADEAILSWDPGSDAQTVQNGLTYNIQVRNETKIVLHSNSLADGTRTIVGLGNAGHSTSKRIKNLEPGTYHFKVQTVDNSYAGSTFTEEFEFQVEEQPLSTVTSIKSLTIYPNPISSNISVSIKNNFNPYHLEIFDIGGNKIHVSEKFIVSQQNLDLSWLMDGIYLLNVIIDDRIVETVRFLKKTR